MKNKTLLILALLSFMILSTSVYAERTGDHALYGIVMGDGEPLEGVEIVIIGEMTKTSKSTYTDEHGVYSIPGLPADEYLVRATPQPPGIYTDGKANAFIVLGKDKEVNFSLTKK